MATSLYLGVYVGIGTVCSFTLNGVFTKFGIPIQSIFGGLIEIQKNEPTRFLEIIKYSGTSIDPLEIFLQSKMTNLSSLIKDGSGKIGANFFEIPANARNQAVRIIKKLNEIGLCNIMMLGHSEHPVLEIPIATGKIGGICIGGLNPLALLTENNIEVISHAISGLADFKTLYHFSKLSSKKFFLK